MLNAPPPTCLGRLPAQNLAPHTRGDGLAGRDQEDRRAGMVGPPSLQHRALGGVSPGLGSVAHRRVHAQGLASALAKGTETKRRGGSDVGGWAMLTGLPTVVAVVLLIANTGKQIFPSWDTHSWGLDRSDEVGVPGILTHVHIFILRSHFALVGMNICTRELGMNILYIIYLYPGAWSTGRGL